VKTEINTVDMVQYNITGHLDMMQYIDQIHLKITLYRVLKPVQLHVNIHCVSDCGMTSTAMPPYLTFINNVTVTTS